MALRRVRGSRRRASGGAADGRSVWVMGRSKQFVIRAAYKAQYDEAKAWCGFGRAKLEIEPSNAMQVLLCALAGFAALLVLTELVSRAVS